jgi:hypothetical protein
MSRHAGNNNPTDTYHTVNKPDATIVYRTVNKPRATNTYLTVNKPGATNIYNVLALLTLCATGMICPAIPDTDPEG